MDKGPSEPMPAPSDPNGRRWRDWNALTILRDAVIAAAAAAVVALAVNALRPGSLPFVAKQAYQIMVPCPVAVGEVIDLAATDARVRAPGTLAIDARAADEFARWHLSGARNVPYDYITPTSPALVRDIAASGASLVVVYGDGDDPDSGHELASELTLAGIRGVHRVLGGASALGAPRPAADPEAGEVVP